MTKIIGQWFNQNLLIWKTKIQNHGLSQVWDLGFDGKLRGMPFPIVHRFSNVRQAEFVKIEWGRARDKGYENKSCNILKAANNVQDSQLNLLICWPENVSVHALITHTTTDVQTHGCRIRAKDSIPRGPGFDYPNHVQSYRQTFHFILLLFTQG